MLTSSSLLKNFRRPNRHASAKRSGFDRAAVLTSEYSKALFTLTYLIAYQLKKIFKKNQTDAELEEHRGMTPHSLSKFNSYFKTHLVKLLEDEER